MATATHYLELLDELATDGKDAFTTRDVAERGRLSPQAASNLVTRLVDRGLVDRVARGHFVMRPFGALGTRAASEDITLAVGAVFAGKPHRIAYRSALDWHGLLEHPSRRIVLAVVKRPGLRELSGRQVRFVVERAERLGVGTTDAGHGARVSSLERALVESAARPSLAGGIQVVATALARAQPDPELLEEIARTLGVRSALHRLGSIADTLDLRPLAEQLEPISSIGRPIPLDPQHTDPREGWRNEKWGVDWPFPASELEETVRR
ncbi:MAG TPA: MarR family transcriptional regulator [Gaiellaceae bacterium]|jgi:predicted transcriptional regulator of viral defense system|nr:MarR family transcriptional regulator [Gaiellaceae bacterium]